MFNKPNPYHTTFQRWEPDATNKAPGELARCMNAFMQAGFTRDETFQLLMVHVAKGGRSGETE